MDWASILVSEAIGIIVTVVIIDRLLSWRERRRWREVRELFLATAHRECEKIMDAWTRWFAGMASQTHLRKLSKDEKESLVLLGYPAPGGDTNRRLTEVYLGRPVGSALKSFAMMCDSKEIADLVQCVGPYFTERLPPEGHSSWSNLYNEIGPPVRKLSDLVDRYSTVVDPVLARAVIRLSIDLDNLKSGGYESGAGRDRFGRVAVAMTMAEGLRQTLELKSYIRHNT